MKFNSQLFTFLLAAVVFVSSSAFAGTKDKVVAKATAAVENGAPDDWKLLAKQANYLISKNAGLSTAKEWIDKSLSITETAYNLEVMGDYYVASNLPKKAINYYLQSADKVKEGNSKAETSWLQDKIVAAKSMY